MNISEYFNEVQEYIKQNIDDASQVDEIVRALNQDDNIQAIVNQSFNNNETIAECGDKLLSTDTGTVVPDQPDQLGGDRGMNTMERKIMKFYSFVNEQKDNKFDYMLLGRLQSDCEYFLGNGNGNEEQLHQLTVDAQISKMKELWNRLQEKPEWLSMEEIEDYEIAMRKMLDV